MCIRAVALYWVLYSLLFNHYHHLSFMPLRYDARNDIIPCWIGPTNCQSDSELEVQKQGMKKNTFLTVDCAVLEDELNRLQTSEVVFLNRTAETEFLVFEFWGQFNSVRFLENQYPTFSSGSALGYCGPSTLTESYGQQLLDAVLHLSYERSELSQWLCHVDSIAKLVLIVSISRQYWHLLKCTVYTKIINQHFVVM